MKKVDIEQFLEEMVEIINKRLEKQEHAIAELQREVKELKRSLSISKIDGSVLEVLRGGRE